MMGASIYTLCTLTSFACAWLLFGSYRRTGHRLLFWSGACFVMMTVNNVLLVLDKLVLSTNLVQARLVCALVAVLLLLFGLIYEKE